MAPIDVVPLAGPCFVIIWLSFILYGLVLAQTYIYFSSYDDHRFLKIVVTLICLLETLQVAACIHIVYTYLIVFFANPLGWEKIIWSITFAMCSEVVINGIVQMFYVYRIWRLYKKLSLFIYLICLLFGRTAIGLRASTITLTDLNDTWTALEASESYRREVIASLSLGVLLDGSITLILMLIMNRHLAFAHKRSNKNVVHKLMFHGIGVGGVTTITSAVTLVLFITSTSPLTYGGMVVIMSRVYANSMLAMLNIRQGLRNDAACADTYSVDLTDVSQRNPPRQASPTKVQIEREVTITRDTFFAANESAIGESTGTQSQSTLCPGSTQNGLGST
ncbi:hypothetical protein BDY19DRAFT_1057142 [Irpex rosettiformis]|uniref:Uncharacterized protein n=1 Tax=Irpex rosettiformis TaxID=378272 RepID=A0ACB8U3X4_9APHY|nr:hypothetical protein BDY19DRAFT_1057142 [Irpex rosettiformis]